MENNRLFLRKEINNNKYSSNNSNSCVYYLHIYMYQILSNKLLKFVNEGKFYVKSSSFRFFSNQREIPRQYFMNIQIEWNHSMKMMLNYYKYKRFYTLLNCYYFLFCFILVESTTIYMITA